ncbi:uncharacterized protein METZ01_LOCUS315520 [marine metagenome]|uniref:Uncharacterized protein n=1 Tax=marine metagenome TaxID=408172 RepID=A0A382NNJ9_9ZZZZ
MRWTVWIWANTATRQGAGLHYRGPRDFARWHRFLILSGVSHGKSDILSPARGIFSLN